MGEAAERRWEVVVGVVVDPFREETVTATLGGEDSSETFPRPFRDASETLREEAAAAAIATSTATATATAATAAATPPCRRLHAQRLSRPRRGRATR